MAVLTASFSRSSSDSSVRWAGAVALALLIHAAVLFISLDVIRGTDSHEPLPIAVEVSLEPPAPKTLPSIPEPPPRTSAANSSIAALIGGETEIFIPSGSPSAPTFSILKPLAITSTSNESIANNRSGELGNGDDGPLAAGGLEGRGDGDGRGSGTGSTIGNGVGGDGKNAGGAGASGSGGAGRGFAGALNKMAGALRESAPREALRLPGKPIFPRSCRQGLCRGGQPCEGSSEWKISVAAAGGKPTKVECVKAMPCELQNAAIRKFFEQADFPKTEQQGVYVFPVRMYVND